jgi:hypothetical protein
LLNIVFAKIFAGARAWSGAKMEIAGRKIAPRLKLSDAIEGWLTLM